VIVIDKHVLAMSGVLLHRVHNSSKTAARDVALQKPLFFVTVPLLFMAQTRLHYFYNSCCGWYYKHVVFVSRVIFLARGSEYKRYCNTWCSYAETFILPDTVNCYKQCPQ
jgi:hypothetical protein